MPTSSFEVDEAIIQIDSSETKKEMRTLTKYQSNVTANGPFYALEDSKFEKYD